MFSGLSPWLILITLLFSNLITSLHAQNVTLIDFGATESGNFFGLTGWDNLLISDRMAYASVGPGGVVLSSEFEEYSDYMGVRGTARDFVLGERIVVTWYNNSDETIRFTSRISFGDEDQPDGGISGGDWFTMRSFDDYRVALSEISPHETVRIAFNITDAGVHKSDGNHSVVNINLAIEWGESVYK